MYDELYILILEDEIAHAEAIRRSIVSKRNCVSIEIAYSIGEFSGFLSKRVPDLILTDINLPDGNFLDEYASRLPEIESPVIIMTSYGDEAVAVQAIKSGALDYIVKSENTFNEIPRLIDRWVREWRNIQKSKQAEDALKESEVRYRLLADNISDTVWLLDLEFNTI